MFRHRQSRRSGAVNVGCLFGAVVLVAFVYLALKFVPAKVALAEVRDACKEEARMGSIKKDGDMIHIILQTAKENEVPLKKEDITIERRSDKIRVTCKIRKVVYLVGGKEVVLDENVDESAPLF